MAAHAILPFIHLDEYVSSIKQTLETLNLDTEKNNNIHGSLLSV